MSQKPPLKPQRTQSKPKPQGSSKQRGLEKDSSEVRVSKTLSWILRHGAKSEGLKMRADGYLRVSELLANPRLQELDLTGLQTVVKADSKQRYDLKLDPEDETWWIRANQGHSIKTVKVEMDRISDASEVPMVVHGTSKAAWEKISQTGLSKMTRTQIHFAQSVHMKNAISGLRSNSTIFIYIDLASALAVGIEFFLSKNGVVLSPGDATGFIPPQYFRRVQTHDWKGIPPFDNKLVQVYSGKGKEPVEVGNDEELKSAMGNDLLEAMEKLDVAGEQTAARSSKEKKNAAGGQGEGKKLDAIGGVSASS